MLSCRLSNGGDYLFQAANDEEMKTWVNAINQVNKIVSETIFQLDIPPLVASTVQSKRLLQCLTIQKSKYAYYGSLNKFLNAGGLDAVYTVQCTLYTLYLLLIIGATFKILEGG